MKKSMLHLFILTVLVVSLVAATGCTQQEETAPPTDTPVVINAKGDREGTPPATSEEEEQPEVVKNWFTKDSEFDGVEGTSADRVYKEMTLTTPRKPVVVAVIDGGVDTTHPDLQGHIWVNEDEVPNNKIDDDRNGYIDDVNGWNFLGTVKDGQIKNINETTLEVTRETVRMKKLEEERKKNGEELSKEEREYLAKVSKEMTEAREAAQKDLDKHNGLKTELLAAYEILKPALSKTYEELTPAILKETKTATPEQETAKQKMITLIEENHLRSTARLNRLIAYFGDQVNFYYNEKFDPRKEIIGDDPMNNRNRFYGNNDVAGPDADHGTHVAGIIAAVRDNGVGIDGIATHVRIMGVRAVPNGDEYDKDVANAVRYAVDNGADIINMSFGKAYSPLKEVVDREFKRAARKGVLIVHAAGNDAKNNDTSSNFPNRNPKSSAHDEADEGDSVVVEDGQRAIGGWLEIGASASKKGPDLPAVFSNYGKVSVDMFSPGVDIESTIPGNQYAAFSGTSMASPAAAGVAALVLSQHPRLRASDLKEILMKTVAPYPGLQVKLPFEGEGEPPLVLFTEISVTGGVVNAMTALKDLL